jgi:catechol 2,3-dioxygenase-like lactoylglutathione lyase family enzyme
MITGIAHINLLVPPGTLPHATTFYSETLGLKPRSVPAHRVHDLAWFDIGDSGQRERSQILTTPMFQTRLAGAVDRAACEDMGPL